MPQNNNIENTSWLLATIIMSSIALAVFLVQRFITQVFDVAVEISVFYIPAVMLAVVYLKHRSSQSSR